MKKLRLCALSLCCLFICCEDHDNPVKPGIDAKWIYIADEATKQTIQCIAVSSDSKEKLYVGTFNGIYKTGNSGKTWTPINSGLTGTDVRSIVVHPQDANVLLCGTWGKGVFMSSDAGQSWQPRWPNDQDPRIQVICISSCSAELIYVGTENGLYGSENSGENWTKYLYGKITAIGLHPFDPNFILVGIRYHGQVRSVDGGKTWEEANDGIHTNDSGHVWANSIVFNQSNADEIYIDTNGYKDMYRSQDSGVTWQSFAASLNPYDVSAFVVDPDNILHQWAATQDHGVWRSRDGGVTWKECNAGLATEQIISLCWIDASDPILIAGTVGDGLYRYIDQE